MGEVAPEDVAEVQAQANAVIMQAHTTIRRELPAGAIQHSFINFVETVVNQVMRQFAHYGRLAKQQVLEVFQKMKATFEQDKAGSIIDSMLQGGVTISSLYMGKTILEWLVNPRLLLGFLGTGEVFAEGIAAGTVTLFSMEAIVVAVIIVVVVAALLVIVGHVTNNLQESYLFFADGLKSHNGYFKELHEKIFGSVLGDNIYNIIDIIISWRGLMEIKYLAPDKLVESMGLSIHKLLDRTHRAWRELSQTALMTEIAADASTVRGYISDGYDWATSFWDSDEK